MSSSTATPEKPAAYQKPKPCYIVQKMFTGETQILDSYEEVKKHIPHKNRKEFVCRRFPSKTAAEKFVKELQEKKAHLRMGNLGTRSGNSGQETDGPVSETIVYYSDGEKLVQEVLPIPMDEEFQAVLKPLQRAYPSSFKSRMPPHSRSVLA